MCDSPEVIVTPESQLVSLSGGGSRHVNGDTDVSGQQ
jgi:hypothetical protein|tara:strand:- start:699 stop:809 length:111 start_codon:yes stop_codon:yes gene_type:complete